MVTSTSLLALVRYGGTWMSAILHETAVPVRLSPDRPLRLLLMHCEHRGLPRLRRATGWRLKGGTN